MRRQPDIGLGMFRQIDVEHRIAGDLAVRHADEFAGIERGFGGAALSN